VSDQEQETQPEPEESEEELDSLEGDEIGEPSEGDDELEPDAVPEPEQHYDEERTEAFKKIDRSFSTYRSSVERNLGDEVVNWLFCPLCSAGAVPGYFNKHDIGRIPEEVAANVSMVLGFAREAEYQPDPGVSVCATCAGRGRTATGSLVGEHTTRTCPNCRGYGYNPPPARAGETLATNGTPPADSTVSVEDFETPDRDNWGEPRVLPDGTLNDNYGKQPQFKQNHPVYGVTRELTGAELAGVDVGGGVL
jgi:hypothetical protein